MILDSSFYHIFHETIVCGSFDHGVEIIYTVRVSRFFIRRESITLRTSVLGSPRVSILRNTDHTYLTGMKIKRARLDRDRRQGC